MNLLESRFCRKETLAEDLILALQGLLFRAGDGASRCGRLVTLDAYAATPFGEKSFLDLAVERTLTPEAEVPRLSPRLALALELSSNAGDAPFPPESRVRARTALFRIVSDSHASEADKDQAIVALDRMNLPRLSLRMIKELRFLVGIRHNLGQQLHTVALDASGFASIPDVPPDAQCWVRLRHGPILALEIAESLRSQSVLPGNDFEVSCETSDWRLQLKPRASRVRTVDLDVSLDADPALGFMATSFAVVATPEESGPDWHVALLDCNGKGVLKGLRRAPCRISLALTPQASVPSGLRSGFDASAELHEEPGRARLSVESRDPVLANRRCVCLWRARAGRATVVGETSLPKATTEGEWHGKAEAKLSFPPGVNPRFLAPRGGAVLGIATARASQRSRPSEFACLVLL